MLTVVRHNMRTCRGNINVAVVDSERSGILKRDFLQEFEITLTKIKGSLGFTLRKEDDSALGHYVRALVREPALTDGRIQAGDKIIAVSVIPAIPAFIASCRPDPAIDTRAVSYVSYLAVKI